ncbi:MAG: hypothetical protein V3T39_02610 [Gammaproteobacteria bacterium]
MHRIPYSLVALLCWAGCLGAAEGLPEQLHRYDIHVADDFSRLDVEACFDKAVPEFLVVGSSAALDRLDYMTVKMNGSTRRLTPRRRRVNIPHVPDDRCVRYGVKTDHINDALRLNIGFKGDSVMLALDYWLWRPTKMDQATDVLLRFHLPAGAQVSGPWQKTVSPDGLPAFLMGRTPYYWPGSIVVGTMHTETLDVAGSTLRLTMLDGLSAEQRSQAREWIKSAAHAVTLMYGEFPLPSPQILIIPVDRGNDASPFARVVRGGGTAAHFLMNLLASKKDFDEDWVAVHELSHMSLPYVRRNDAWLSEGFASYYQNVLRARAGMLTPVEAWQKLHEGFGRGTRGTRRVTLAEATRRMGPDNNYMRVYWSGAAMALIADVQLRHQSNGELSLDVAMARLKHCCLDSNRSWSGKEIMEKLDTLTETTIFSSLYNKQVYSRSFPNLRPLYRQLGLEIKRDKVSLHKNAPLFELRDAIMRPDTHSYAEAATSARQ